MEVRKWKGWYLVTRNNITIYQTPIKRELQEWLASGNRRPVWIESSDLNKEPSRKAYLVTNQ